MSSDSVELKQLEKQEPFTAGAGLLAITGQEEGRNTD